MSQEKYNSCAYRAVTFKEAARLLRERYFPESNTPPELPCDAAFRASHSVPSEIIQEVLISLQRAAKQNEEEMMHYKLAEIQNDEIQSLTGSETGKKRGRPKNAR